jgi:hypothetical protein
MTDFINKIITIALIFVMLVLAPIMISYKTDEMLAKREILNDVDTFIDKICDAGAIKQADIDELYMQCNSHGMVIDVTVERLVYATTVDTQTNVVNYDYIVDTNFGTESTLLNPSDMIKVSVNEMVYSSTRRITYKLLGVDEGFFSFSLCGIVG